MRRLLLLIGLLLTGCQLSHRGPADLLLADGGQARLPVVISPHASELTRQVAAELTNYLARITGATFPLQTGDGSTGIVLGVLADFPTPTLTRALAIRDGYDGREAYAIRTEPSRLLLLGATDLGASHAAFRFLESLDCRWFFPAKEWEVVPHTPTLRVALNETDRPSILARRIWYGYGFFDTVAQQDYAAWCRHNRLAQSFTVHCWHAYHSLYEAHRAEFDAHPEYLALVNGKRQPSQLCLSHPEVRRLATAWALQWLANHPAADMVSLEPNDVPQHCECDSCLQLGSVSDRVFGLANEVARAIATRAPGKMVGVLAYSSHSSPPSFPLEPNVHVQTTVGNNFGEHRFEELLTLWARRSRNRGFYEYFSVWLWDFDLLPGGRAASLHYVRDRIRQYHAAGARSMDCESSNSWGPHGRGYYVAAKLMWNPHADMDAILADFHEQAFGPAAAAVRRYYDRFDPATAPPVSDQQLALGFRDLEEATRLAADRPEVQARLDHLKIYLHYVHLRWQLDTEADSARQNEIKQRIQNHLFRSRRSYTVHWSAARAAPHAPAVTAADRPHTPDEIEQMLREGLSTFQPRAVTERSFSTALAPVDAVADGGWSEEPRSTSAVADHVLSFQTYQPVRYALWSNHGEPLMVTITPGLLEIYRTRAAAAYHVTDSTGHVLSQGRLPLDNQPHALRVAVPRPGLYWLTWDDSFAGGRVQIPASHQPVLALTKTRQMASLTPAPRLFFHVPRGTREIQYYWSGGAHDVRDPDGNVAQTVRGCGQIGRVVTVPVPAGSDGKAWSLSAPGFYFGRLWFFNVPNYVATAPEALLIPRELTTTSP